MLPNRRQVVLGQNLPVALASGKGAKAEAGAEWQAAKSGTVLTFDKCDPRPDKNYGSGRSWLSGYRALTGMI